ncbi:MAG: flagellar motor switch protein FliN [Candidatus Sulfotelmatobacter sp.]
MTDSTADTLETKSPDYVQIYAQIWVDSFSQVIAQITGAPVPCQILREAPADLKPAAEAESENQDKDDKDKNKNKDKENLWVVVTSAGALRGEMSFRLSPASILRLGQAFMSEPPAPDSPLTADHRESVIELLRQVSGIVASGARARWGELQLSLEGAAAAPSWAAAESFWLQAGAETPPSMLLEFGLSAALVAELRAGKAEAAKIETAKAAIDSSPEIQPADSEPAAGALDLLMDVQLAVSMRFGSRRLLLREVLDLSPGAVVELDRRVQEPVDLLLDGRLIARGEVVVIDGNYGLRVSEVSPQAPAPGRHDG